jgi:hypothetical protein
MRYQTQITAKIKGQGTFQNYVTNLNLDDNITVANFKEEIKKTSKFLDHFTIEKETVYLGSKELSNEEIVPTDKSGLQFLIEIVQK